MVAITHPRAGLLLQGRYRLRAEIGAGGSAHVFLAEDTRLERPVAVKVLHDSLAHDPALIERFRAEARAAATLNHPSIVHVYDWGGVPGDLHLVLEYLSGGSLRDLLRRGGKLSVAQAATIGQSVALALAFAHQRGFVHRDVKPANLLFDESGSVHLADFGLAETLATAGVGDGRLVGTARYASPEQALGRPLAAATDVYSLAVVLYEAVTGETPLSGETLDGLLRARPDRPLSLPKALGPLAPCLEEAAHPSAERRLTAAEFADALRRVCAVLPPPEPIDSGQTSPSPNGTDADDLTEFASVGGSNTVSLAAARPSSLLTKPAARDHDSVASAPRSRPHRRRFAPVIFLLSVLMLLAVGAFAAGRFVVFNHVVPNVTDDPLGSARHLVGKAGLRLDIGRTTFSSTVAAGSVISESPRPGTRERSGSEVTLDISKGPADVALPQVHGLTKSAAVVALQRVHLVASVTTTYSETVPVGQVLRSSPSGRTAPFGSTVRLVVSLGPQPRTLPQFPLTEFAAARQQLLDLRLVPVERLVFSNVVPTGLVISTDPPEGTTGIVVGSRVLVTVSKGPHLVAVPTVANESIVDAVAQLQQLGLEVNEQIGPPFATKAVTTDPAPGTSVRVGSAVTLYVS